MAPSASDSKWPTPHTSADDVPDIPLNIFRDALGTGEGTLVHACCEEELSELIKTSIVAANLYKSPLVNKERFI